MFKGNDVREFQKDRVNVPAIAGNELNVFVIALASSEYYRNYRKYGKHDILSNQNFDALVTWKQMSELYHREIYSEADRKYKN